MCVCVCVCVCTRQLFHTYKSTHITSTTCHQLSSAGNWVKIFTIVLYISSNTAPTETVVRAMSDIVRSGKATAWGTSEWSAQQFTEAVWFANANGLEPPMMEQPQYNMFHRERFETEYAPLYKQPYNLGTTIWSPLASGLLTGKYNKSVPKGSRIDNAAHLGYGWLWDKLKDWRESGKIDKVKQLTEYADKELDCSVTQLALAWCVKNNNVSTVLLGATKPYQLKENLGAIPVARRMTQKHMDDIEKILQTKPSPYTGYGGSGRRSIDSI